MSRIYFHSMAEDAEVRGSERAMGANLCTKITMAMMPDIEDNIPFYRDLIGEDQYPFKPPFRADSVDCYLRVSQNPLNVCGSEMDLFTLSLNSAMVIGGNALRLLARLHGQCEIHTWVDGPNRAWLARIIDEGLESRLMRAKSGWESVSAMLLRRDDEPVVTSYSVCRQFPNQSIAGIPYDENNEDVFCDLTVDEQWRLSMAGLNKVPKMEMRPDDWKDYRFGNCLSVIDLIEDYYAKQRESEFAN